MTPPTQLTRTSLKLPDPKPDTFTRRFGRYAKGAVLPETQVPSCPKVKVADFPQGWLPQKFFEYLEHNQKIAHCCRHPENHFIEGRKSHPDEKVTDIYIFHCDQCGRKHRIFCVGIEDNDRPEWK